MFDQSIWAQMTEGLRKLSYFPVKRNKNKVAADVSKGHDAKKV